MFQYTTETIINSNEGNLVVEGQDKKVRFALLEDADAPEDGFFIIDGTNTFKVGGIKKIYHSPYRKATPATAKITVKGTTPIVDKETVLRLTVTLYEIGNVRSNIQNAYLQNTKPFHFEVLAKANLNDTLAELVKIVKKSLRESDFKYFDVEYASTTLTFTAKDCYIQFKDIELGIVDQEAACGDCGVHGGYARQYVTSIVDDCKITLGDQGAGTAARIIKDLRIPTNASINPFAADHGGLPIPGGKYDQYLIEYVTDRRHVAGGVVGSLNTSLTSHVFFVEEKAKKEWNEIMTKIGDVIGAGKGVDETGKAEAKPANANVTVDKSGKGEHTFKKVSEMGSVE